MNMENKHNADDYSKISPTAKITAYWRSLTDIPFSTQIADTIGAEQGAKQLYGDKITVTARFSPAFLEARYKAVDAVLQKYPAYNVLELACGLSPRGLGLAAHNKRYVGADLPGMIAESAPVIAAIAAEQGIPAQHLHFMPVNVLEVSQLQDAVATFEGERFAICNEGLLMYLNTEEKEKMAQNIRAMLSLSGGYWVTPDVGYTNIRKKLMTSLAPEVKEKLAALLGSISSQVGRDLVGNDFATESEAVDFYERAGFSIEEYPFYDESYTISTLSLLPEEMRKPVMDVFREAKIWILRPTP
jgi:O-methyltransferase involved in polyketide biosynthesis